MLFLQPHTFFLIWVSLGAPSSVFLYFLFVSLSLSFFSSISHVFYLEFLYIIYRRCIFQLTSWSCCYLLLIFLTIEGIALCTPEAPFVLDVPGMSTIYKDVIYLIMRLPSGASHVFFCDTYIQFRDNRVHHKDAVYLEFMTKKKNIHPSYGRLLGYEENSSRPLFGRGGNAQPISP